jgi:CRISPR-associated exonuclease Cas4
MAGVDWWSAVISSPGLLGLTVVLLGLLAVAALGHHTRRERERLGIGIGAGRLIAVDDTPDGGLTLRSDSLGLVGRPDQVVRLRDGALIPVEQKPSARRLHESHMLQVAAQCALIEEVYGRRPPYGVVVLRDGVRAQVRYTAELEARLLETLDEMRDLLADGSEPGARWVEPRCTACGFLKVCWSPA